MWEYNIFEEGEGEGRIWIVIPILWWHSHVILLWDASQAVSEVHVWRNWAHPGYFVCPDPFHRARTVAFSSRLAETRSAASSQFPHLHGKKSCHKERKGERREEIHHVRQWLETWKIQVVFYSTTTFLLHLRGLLLSVFSLLTVEANPSILRDISKIKTKKPHKNHSVYHSNRNYRCSGNRQETGLCYFLANTYRHFFKAWATCLCCCS